MTRAHLILLTRGLRALADGCIGVVLPAYLLMLGFSPLQVGFVTTATLLGSALLTILVGLRGSRYGLRRLLIASGILMALTGIGFFSVSAFWPLLLIAFVGTLNPSAGDVSVFLPLEQATLTSTVPNRKRTDLFALYALAGSLAGAFGTLLAALPDLLTSDRPTSFRILFLLYGAIGLIVALLYRNLPSDPPQPAAAPHAALGSSRGFVLRIAALFSIDSFAGGLVVQSILALWLFQRFDLSVASVAQIFFVMQLLSAASYLIAAKLAARFGLINTMVFSHLPANLCLIALPFSQNVEFAITLLLVRGLLSQMDVPTRNSYVMAIVTPQERPAAASFAVVPRSLAAALGPTLGGYLLGLGPFGWPFIAGGALKIVYDLALFSLFRHHRPPEERRTGDVAPLS